MGVLGAGTAQKGTGTAPKKGGLRHVYNPKKGGIYNLFCKKRGSQELKLLKKGVLGAYLFIFTFTYHHAQLGGYVLAG